MCGLVGVSYDLGVIGGCGQCPGTGFQKVGAYEAVWSMTCCVVYLLTGHTLTLQ